jgi:hypothetical protein
MSVVGGSYEYDVFFSYAWAEGETNDQALRDWSRMVADQISTLIKVRFSKVGTLNRYLDRDVNNKSGIELDKSLQKAAEKAAVFVAMISPYYDSDYCQKELCWFLDRAAIEGGTCAERLCLFVIQDDDELKWPSRLRELNGTRLLYKKFHSESGQPLELASFLNRAPTPLLAAPIEDAALEIGNKIKAMKDKMQARIDYEVSQRVPDNLIVFLEAEKEDEVRWAERRRQLREEGANIILPAKAPPMPATSLQNPATTYIGCDGMVLLRSRADDAIGERIKRAYLDRRQIYREGNGMVPWALLDELDEPPPEGEAFDIPRVVPVGAWVAELQQKLIGT